MQVWLTLFWCISAGYVTAGLLASFYQLLADRPLSFTMLTSTPVASVLAVPLLVMSGPAVIVRNTARGRVVEGRAWGWILASIVIVGFWSFMTGVVVLQTLFSLMS